MKGTYDPGKVVVVFLGGNLSGFAKGTFIECDRNEDTFKLSVGADGEGARTRNQNKSGKITITLMQSSDSNAVLSAAQELDEIAGLGVGPFLVKDLQGTSLSGAENAWIVKPAKQDYGDELGDRKWMLETDSLQILNGGLTPLP